MASDEELDRYMRELVRREDRGERLTIELGPHTALTLLGVLQWAIRTNSQMAEHGPAIFERFVAELRRVFADEPAALTLITLHEPPHEAI